MWQSPSQRNRALAGAKQRERDRLRRAIHINRVQVELHHASPEGPETVIQARVLLNDLNPTGFNLYSTQNLSPGVTVTLVLNEPRLFEIEAKVLWCQDQPSAHHILSPNAYTYRVTLELRFADDTKKVEFEKFCQEVTAKYNFVGGLPKAA